MNGCLADKEKGTDRQKLLEDASTDSKPMARTAEEIKAKYRKPGVDLSCENSVIYLFLLTCLDLVTGFRMPPRQLPLQGINLYSGKKNSR